MLTSLVAGRWALAQSSERGFLDREFVDPDSGDRHQYVVFVPNEEPPAEGWPVVLYLHGAGERGTDGRRQSAIGLGPAVKRRAEDFGAVVVFPQADFADGPILETWRTSEPGGRTAMKVLAEVERTYPIDPQRRTVTGWSMGGYGALALAAADPDHWSKVLALSGGGEREWAETLSHAAGLARPRLEGRDRACLRKPRDGCRSEKT